VGKPWTASPGGADQSVGFGADEQVTMPLLAERCGDV
jgi:hypothetical protein